MGIVLGIVLGIVVPNSYFPIAAKYRYTLVLRHDTAFVVHMVAGARTLGQAAPPSVPVLTAAVRRIQDII